MVVAIKKYVTYIRVSTRGQKESGLGLESQKAIIQTYIKREPGSVVAEYMEAESGRKNDRPELAKALSHARRTGAILLVAKLDRLSRDAAFLLKLMAGSVPIRFADLPEGNELLVGMMAIVAQYEAKLISQRTAAGLKAAIETRGKKLGSAGMRPVRMPDGQVVGHIEHWDGLSREGVPMAACRIKGAAAGAVQSAKARHQRLAEALNDYKDQLAQMKAMGKTYRQIADALNAGNFSQPNNNPWHEVAVCRAMKLLGLTLTRENL